MMFFYPAKVNDMLSGQPFEPELVTGRVMVNPHRPVAVPAGVLVVSDSGAFQLEDMVNRLEPEEALERQLAYEVSRTRDGRRRFPGGFEALITYDMLLGVDEALEQRGGQVVRVKRRGSELAAGAAVDATVASAVRYWMAQDRIAGAIAYAAQGATLRQYLACVDLLLDLARPGRDWLALGGFCIVGLVPSLKPLFVAVCRAVAPRCRRAGIRRVHILGVCAWDALAAAAAIFAGECIEVSTDSSSIEMNSIMGRTWREEHMTRRRGASPWRQMYTKSEKCAPGGYHPAALSLENIRRFAAWLERAEHVPHAIPGFQDALNVSAPPPMRVDCWQSDGVAVAFEVSFFAELDEVLAAAAELTDAPIVELQTDRWVWLNEWGTRTRTWGEAERESHG